MRQRIKFLTDRQTFLSTTLKPVIADMQRSEVVSDKRGNKIFTYKYDEKHSAPMLTEALCFQPWALAPYFKKGIAQNSDGTLLRDKAGHPIMENDLCKEKRTEYKNQCKHLYGDNWKKAFYNGRTDAPLLN